MAVVANGRYDSGQRRQSKRSGREAGCWLYVPQEELVKAEAERLEMVES